uniref:Uncharacterized protein n=1 Tax=Rhizophora mucronata TaxID=61149 RepID=A0A2P2NNB0_RHIMU
MMNAEYHIHGLSAVSVTVTKKPTRPQTNQNIHALLLSLLRVFFNFLFFQKGRERKKKNCALIYNF